MCQATFALLANTRYQQMRTMTPRWWQKFSLETALNPRTALSQFAKRELYLIKSTRANAVLKGTQGLRSAMSLVSSSVL